MTDRIFRSLGVVGLAVLIGACSPGQSTDVAKVSAAPQIESAEETTASEQASSLSSMPAGSYELEKTHAYITFSYLHLGFSRPHVGFENFDVQLDLDPENIEASTFALTVDVESVYSQVEKYNAHLKSDDFFDVANHPTFGFVATDVVVDGDKLTISGDLTIKGISKPLTVDALINKAGNHPMKNVPTIGVSATAKLNRSDWDLGYAVPAVSDEVSIYFEAELIKTP